MLAVDTVIRYKFCMNSSTTPPIGSRPPERLADLRRKWLKITTARIGTMLAADVVGLAASLFGSLLITALFSPHLAGRSLADYFAETEALRLPQFFGIAGLLLLWRLHRGDYGEYLPPWIETRNIVEACCIALLGDAALQFAFKHDFSRLWLISTWALAVPILVIVRQMAHAALRHLGLGETPVLVIGSPGRMELAMDLLGSQPNLGYRAVGGLHFIAEEWTPKESWRERCARHGAIMVVLAFDEAELLRHRDMISRLVLERLPFVCIQPLAGLPVLSLKPLYLLGHDVILLIERSRLDPIAQVIKRGFDLAVALSLLLVLSPLILVLALLVRRDGGTVFYAHRRLGSDGKPFSCLKFRTMVRGADRQLSRMVQDNASHADEWTQSMKLRNDPRITPLGRILRASSLDELPQLINVVKGDMSLVGPRPIVAEEAHLFGDELVYYFQVRPGITGLWQVTGRNTLHYSQRVRLNTWYVKNWSLWLDVFILILTIPAVLRREGAY